MVCIVVCVGVLDPDKSVREGGAVLEIGLYSVEKGDIHILEPIFKRHNTNTSALRDWIMFQCNMTRQCVVS